MWAIAGTVEEVWDSVGYSREGRRGVGQCGRQQGGEKRCGTVWAIAGTVEEV